MGRSTDKLGDALEQTPGKGKDTVKEGKDDVEGGLDDGKDRLEQSL